ncbi:MAG: nuclear transport factor 2 family protein [Chitinophagaceae bacterium]|nr:MAG: nuclear transport factor 2 family protein [Chitinophagaceae bacterium]
MSNRAIVEQFYTAFARLDFQTMQGLYSDDAIFSDPVFLTLDASQVRAMWQMLSSGAKDWSLSWGGIEEIDEEYITCKWVAQYTFSGTGRSVVNHVKAYMRIREGKIIEHSDAFRLSKWMGQALGWKGVLFGWTSVMKKAVQRKARRRLDSYMEKWSY